MYARNVLLFASILLPVIGAPVATKETNSIQQRSANVLSRLSSYVSKRDPLIERIPEKALSDIVFETKRDADTKDSLALDEEDDDVTDLEIDPTVEERAVRGGRTYGGGKRSIDERAVRGGRTFGGGRRSVDERAVRGPGRPAFGGGRRSVDERAVRGPGRPAFGGGKRSVDERAVRGPGRPAFGGGKRSVDERAVRGPGHTGGRRSLDERAVRGPGHIGGRRSPDENAVQDQ